MDIPLKFLLQVQKKSEWENAKEDFKRGNYTKIVNFFKQSVKDGYMLDFSTFENTRQNVWFVNFLWDLCKDGCYREHGDKLNLDLNKYERYIVVIYYLMLSVADTFPTETVTKDHFLNCLVNFSNHLIEEQIKLPEKVKEDIRAVLVLFQLNEGNYYEVIKSLVN